MSKSLQKKTKQELVSNFDMLAYQGVVFGSCRLKSFFSNLFETSDYFLFSYAIRDVFHFLTPEKSVKFVHQQVLTFAFIQGFSLKLNSTPSLNDCKCFFMSLETSPRYLQLYLGLALPLLFTFLSYFYYLYFLHIRSVSSFKALFFQVCERSIARNVNYAVYLL